MKKVAAILPLSVKTRIDKWNKLTPAAKDICNQEWVKRVSKEYIYLDWNIIQYAKNPRQGKQDADIAPLLKKLSKKYRIPYSEAHLRDLASGFTEKTKKYVDDDLKFLSEITKSEALVWLTSTGKQSDFIGIRPGDCERDFAAILNAIDEEKNAVLKFSSKGDWAALFDVSMLDRDDLFFEFLEKNNGKLDSSVISSILQVLRDRQNDPEFYKKFRRQVQNLVGILEKRADTIIGRSPALNAELLPFLKYLSLEGREEVRQAFLPALIAFAKITGEDFKEFPMGRKLEVAYGVLDFQPIFSEKVSDKNRPFNQLRDLKHLLYASSARIFVTEDAASLEKSRLVISTLGMKVKALNASEFVARFS